jgi:hypothetical protein
MSRKLGKCIGRALAAIIRALIEGRARRLVQIE